MVSDFTNSGTELVAYEGANQLTFQKPNTIVTNKSFEADTTDTHSDFSSLESGNFGIMEPKEDCQVDNYLDIIVVPTVGISPSGVRLGYGHGFYDKFLEKNSLTKSTI